VVLEDTPLTKQTLKLHEGLWKAENALLTQARTERIGLAKFLYGQMSQYNPVKGLFDSWLTPDPC